MRRRLRGVCYVLDPVVCLRHSTISEYVLDFESERIDTTAYRRKSRRTNTTNVRIIERVSYGVQNNRNQFTIARKTNHECVNDNDDNFPSYMASRHIEGVYCLLRNEAKTLYTNVVCSMFGYSYLN